MDETICGFAFPFRLDAGGGLAETSGTDKLKQNIIHLLLTGIGERVMRRDYGGGLRELVHDPNNDALRAITQYQIARAIEQWEPRVQVQGVTIVQSDGELFIQLRYSIRQIQQPQNLSIPIGVGGIYP